MRRHRCIRVTGTILGLSALLTARPAAATVVTFTCTGTITNGGTDRDVFDSSVGPGTPFYAAFAVDTTAIDIVAYDANAWTYVDHNARNQAYIQFGNYSLGPDLATGALNGLAGVNDSGGVDMYQWQSDNSAGSGLNSAFVVASLQDNTGTAITAKGLPPAGPGLSDISRWGSSEFSFMATSSANGHRHGWYGKIDSISTDVQPNPVPEPGSLSMLAVTGLPCLTLILRRRKPFASR